MAAGLAAYLGELRQALEPALCLHEFPSPVTERHNKPLIETEQPGSEFLLEPITVSRSPQEHALIERSINSMRLSLRFKVAPDGVEEYLLRSFLRFMVHRADQLDIVRRVAMPGYHLTFLITSSHLERYQRDRLIDFICKFVEDLYAEISAMKLSLRSRGRAVVQDFWQQLEQQQERGSVAAAVEGGGS